jgi:ribosomal protein S27E
MAAGNVTGSPPMDFRCPGCGAPYKLIRQPAENPDVLDVPVDCPACGQSLPSSDGGDALKYFLVPRSR